LERQTHGDGAATSNGGNDGNHVQFLLDSNADNLENNDDAYLATPTTPTVDSCFQMLTNVNYLKGNILLLDSCSTVNLVLNGDLLHDIKEVEWHIRVRCNAGVRTTNQQGRLGNFPEPVWYNPKGVANILSLNSVKRHYHGTYDRNSNDTFIVTDDKGRKLHFTPTKKGLYTLRGPSNGEQQWSFLNTVSDRKDIYTKREVQAANRARQVQNIMMYPSRRQFLEISDKNLIRNNPVQRADINAAENIYGSNLGALLKGKTVTRKGDPVNGRIAGVPPAIKDKFRSVTLCMDIMFVNKIPFLVTISRGLHFGTVKNLPNRQVPTVSKALNRACAHYSRRGFPVKTVLADPEFVPLQAELHGLQFNYCKQHEHIPEIE
jgi:hypothetical protein